MTTILAQLRKELHELNKKIVRHRSVKSPNMDILRRFSMSQLYVVPYDAKALSIILSRTRSDDEFSFFKGLLDNDCAAYEALQKLADELEVGLDYSKIQPRAVAYTHFLSWLALHGTVGEAALAMVVNLPVWGGNVERLSRWTKRQMVKNTKFMELFKGPYDKLEEDAGPIIHRYLDWDRYRYTARAIQQYELDFWEGIA